MKFSKKEKIKTELFIIPLVLSILISRLMVYLFFTQRTEIFRSISGLSFHHFHYGILLLMSSVIFLIFLKETKFIVALAGIGSGLIIDSFIPSLLLKTERASEISAYNQGLFPTLILLVGVIIIILTKNLLIKHSKIK